VFAKRSLRKVLIDFALWERSYGAHDFAKANNQSDLDAINESGDYNDDIAAKLKGICEAFAEKGAY
jgi:hypothetical protein